MHRIAARLVSESTAIAVKLGLSVPVVFAAPKSKEQVLVVYGRNRGLHIFDPNAPGIDHGDLFPAKMRFRFHSINRLLDTPAKGPTAPRGRE
jgi:hypothetical protein